MGDRFFIVIEGVDGTGKSSVSSLLAQELNAHHFSTPSTEFLQLREWVDRAVTVNMRFIYYLTTVVSASGKIEELLQTASVVCDRYILSTKVYHIAMALNPEYLRVFDTIDLIEPTYTFYLHCNEAERLRRIKQREGQEEDERNTRDIRATVREFEKELARGNAVKIDTTDRSIESVAVQILRYIRE